MMYFSKKNHFKEKPKAVNSLCSLSVVTAPFSAETAKHSYLISVLIETVL